MICRRLARKQGSLPAWAWLLLALVPPAAGCLGTVAAPHVRQLEQYLDVATQIEYPDAQVDLAQVLESNTDPTAVAEGKEAEYWDMTLENALRIALCSAPVLRDLGAVAVTSSERAKTHWDPAIEETDPRTGVEAALSAFDASLAARTFYEKNDRRFNNRVFGLNGFLDQDLVTTDAELTKRAATGSQFTLRQSWVYDSNNSPTNTFRSSAWDAIVEAEFRQPFLQGAGVEFNRIAGPDGRPGYSNGVLLARVKTDISLTDFEMGVRDFVSNVENAYWDLYFAYRELDARKQARDASLETWRYVEARKKNDLARSAQEAQAREQYFRFEEEVVNSLKGRPVEGTRVFNGSGGGTFRPSGGVRVAERRLRHLLGVPVTDSRLIRPVTEPSPAKTLFDWDAASAECITRRVELRRQRWIVKQRELEHLASHNYVKPKLDAVGRYRMRGFGHDLMNEGDQHDPQFDNAYGNLATGDFQEWELGLEFSMPIGFRQGHAAVRNAQLKLARERSILAELEREAILDLSNAIAEMDRAHTALDIAYSRLQAAKEQLDVLRAMFELDDPKARLEVVLEAQRRYAEALNQYYLARVEHAIAVKNIHFAKGSLLEQYSIELAEGPWPEKAYYDAAIREFLRGRCHRMSYIGNLDVAVPQCPPCPDRPTRLP